MEWHPVPRIPTNSDEQLPETVPVVPLPPLQPLSQVEGAPRATPERLIDAPLGLPSWQLT